MPLDDLVSVIETLQQRIREHGDALHQNEYRTRMALIDPLLTALGWDTADPSLVMPEYSVSGQRVDYALLGRDSKPAATLEAKKLDEPLPPNANAELLQRCRYQICRVDRWQSLGIVRRIQAKPIRRAVLTGLAYCRHTGPRVRTAITVALAAQLGVWSTRSGESTDSISANARSKSSRAVCQNADTHHTSTGTTQF